MNGQEQNEPPRPCACTRTPLHGRGISRCIIENRITLYGRPLPKSPLSTREGIKLHSGKLPKAELLKPTSKKKNRAFPSLGGVAAAQADDGVVFPRKYPETLLPKSSRTKEKPHIPRIDEPPRPCAKHTDTPPGEGNIPVFNRDSDKVVWSASTEISIINTGRNKTTLSKTTQS